MHDVMRTCLAVLFGLALTATGLWAAAAEEEPAAAMGKEMVLDPTTGKMVTAPEYGGTFTWGTCSIHHTVIPTCMATGRGPSLSWRRSSESTTGEPTGMNGVLGPLGLRCVSQPERWRRAGRWSTH